VHVLGHRGLGGPGDSKLHSGPTTRNEREGEKRVGTQSFGTELLILEEQPSIDLCMRQICRL